MFSSQADCQDRYDEGYAAGYKAGREQGYKEGFRGMHFTPETPIYSMRGCGGLPADAGGV